MGFLTTGSGSSPQMIKSLIAEVFASVSSQKAADQQAIVFRQKLKERGVLMRPAWKDKPGTITWTKERGVVVDNYTFVFGTTDAE